MTSNKKASPVKLLIWTLITNFSAAQCSESLINNIPQERGQKIQNIFISDADMAQKPCDIIGIDTAYTDMICNDLRVINNSYIRPNSDQNVDMRMTGSTTLLGKVTLPYTQKNTLITSGTKTMGITPSGEIGIVNSITLPPGDTTITGTLQVIGSTTITSTVSILGQLIIDDKRVFGQKTLDPIAAIPGSTPALTLNFKRPAGTTDPVFKGANARLQCFISGTILGIASTFLYEADLYISPATTAGGTPPGIIPLSEVTTTIQGTLLPANIVASTSGTGTNVTISFGSLLTMTNQSVTLFYEVVSDNLVRAF